MQNNHISFWSILLAFLAVTSCKSTKFSGTAACAGRICGPKGEAVSNYQVDFGSLHSARTSLNGMFVIPELRAGTYKVSGGGKGWKSFETTVEFTDRRQVFTAQVEPISTLYSQVEELIREKNYAEAEKLLEKEKKFNKGEKQFQFYEKLVSYCKNPSDEKKNSLLKLFGREPKNAEQKNENSEQNQSKTESK